MQFATTVSMFTRNEKEADSRAKSGKQEEATFNFDLSSPLLQCLLFCTCLFLPQLSGLQIKTRHGHRAPLPLGLRSMLPQVQLISRAATQSTKRKILSGTSKLFKVSRFSSAPNHRTSLCSNTAGVYPDTLTIENPVAVTLDGIILLFADDGFPLDFTVDTNDGSGWSQRAKITKNAEVLKFIKFPKSLLCLQLRVKVTLAQKSPAGEYTRIAEISPVYADLTASIQSSNSTSSSTSLNSTTTPSPATTKTTTQSPATAKTTTPSPDTTKTTTQSPATANTTTPSPATTNTTTPTTNSTQKPNTTAIIAGVLGAIAGVLILVLILLLRRLRNNNGGRTPTIDEHHHHPWPPSSTGAANTSIPQLSSYAPDLTEGSGASVMPSSSPFLYPPNHYSSMGNTALNPSASPQSHNLSTATTAPAITNTNIPTSPSSSYPGVISDATIEKKRPTEVHGSDFAIELPGRHIM